MSSRERSSIVVVAVVMIAALGLMWTSSTALAQGQVYFYPGGISWYASNAVSVTPEPPIAGQNVEICANLQNPTEVGYTVTLRYYAADFAIGADFTLIAESSVYVPQYSNVRDCIQWVPPGPGPWSFQVRLSQFGFPDEVVERNIDMFERLEPLTPDTLAFTVRNPTPSTTTITLGLVPQLSGWGLELSQDVILNLPSGGEQAVQLITTPPSTLPVDGTPVVDVVAYIGGEVLSGFRKIYRSAAPCDGVRLDLNPAVAKSTGTGDNEERGAYVTAIRGFQVCAIGMEIGLETTPQTVIARIYDADGTTRGALLAEGSATAMVAGKVYHYVPMDFELLPCHDYDIAFEFSGNADFDYYNETTGFEPFDVGGVIRVRDGEYAAGASNFVLPRLSLVGSLPGDHIITDLAPEGVEWSSCGDATTDRGVYVTPHRTITMSALGFAADYSTVPVVLNAFVYDGAGRVRGDVIARGSTIVTTTGLAMHSIPISAVLEEGMEYDLAVTFPATSWSCKGESQVPLPFTVGGVLSVDDGELNGNASNAILAHFTVEWSEGAGGQPFSLAKTTDVYPPPLISLDSSTNYGLFVTSLVDQEAYSLGWEADMQPGEPLYAWVFEASGTSRGALVSSGSTVAVEGQTRWHDIPIAATLGAGADYNVEIGFGQTNQWAFWEDYTGMPYSTYGLFEVYAASQGGSTSGHRIIHMRVNACSETATAVEPRPTQPPRFTLDAPYPNPMSQSTSLGYSIDEAGVVTISVYDVAGRRVAVLLDNASRPAGPGQLELDTRNMAAGVYFVKMEMGAKSVSRKVTIVR